MMELESQEAAWSLIDTDVRNQITTLLYAMTTLSPRLPIVGMCPIALEKQGCRLIFRSCCSY